MNRIVIWLFLLIFICESWAISRPMESIENYNVMIVHGAYSKDEGFLDEKDTNEAYYAGSSLENGATLGAYDNSDRITNWVSTEILEEPGWTNKSDYVKNSYVYNWRSFSNPANTSLNNAREMGDRTWILKDTKYKHRRTLFEEAQEVKASFYDKNIPGDVYGQIALDSMRQYPDLYRQLASRYILIGHSMGGVVSREYVQGDFYNGDVDKIITLDSPHEGTGALNMLVSKRLDDNFWTHTKDNIKSSIPGAVASAIPMLLASNATTIGNAVAIIAANTVLQELGDLIVSGLIWADKAPSYYSEDPLVHYVDPEQKGYQTIDSLNRLPYVPDSLPMFRILASQHGMTYTDPEVIDYGYAQNFHTLAADNYKLPLWNYAAQKSGTGDFSARYVNALTAHILGYAGIAMTTTGSSIVPASSSEGKNVGVLNDGNVDVRRSYFNAAPNASGAFGDVATAFDIAINAILAVDKTLDYVLPGMSDEIKIAMGFAAGSVQEGLSLAAALGIGIADIAVSHQLPIEKDFKDWMLNDSTHIYEDFLYERPFVNLALNDTATLNQLQGMSSTAREKSTLNRNCYYIGSKDGVNCAVGLFKAANDLNSTQRNQPLSGLTTPLRFKSESDWSKMGVKVDRWEKVDGLHPDGSENEKGVPIRHVERYEAPAITVDNWIEKYSFVVDDLMPHRLRQIRINFNFVTEIAWECDITKAEDDDKACKVYQRSAGEPWGEPKKTVRHPVKKNGLFDFNPRDYGYDNLFAIQKDNQNTVTISTVNKIGLSNTQRFYYLFKATENLLKSNWPTRDVVLNRIEGFEAYASVLNYQGFSVDSAYDVVYKGDDIEHGTRLKMKGTPNGVQDMDFESRQQMDTLSDGEYAWQFRAYATNNTTGDLDTSKFYNALFSIDRVAPKFSLYTDNSFVNPDSANFVVRYRWNGGDSVTPDIRAMRWTLEKGCSLPNDTATAAEANCTGSISLPAMYDVATRDFAVSWDKIPVDTRKNLADGLYRIKAYALDYAVPNRLMYDSVNALIGRIMDSPNSLIDADWKLVRDSSARLNDTTVYAMFRIDRTAPVISDIVPKSAYVVDAIGMSDAMGALVSNKYDSLSRPTRDARYVYVSEDSLLELSYKVTESTSGQDSSVVMVAWNFEHVGESKSVDRAGDSVWVSGTSVKALWKEVAGLQLADGIYRIRATIRDRAGNKSDSAATKLVRIDRTAPNIVSLVSRRLVYPDDDRDFSATLKVDQAYDVDSNRTGMYCHYRVSGGDADRKWKPVLHDSRNALIKADSVVFTLDSAAVGTEKGKRYLEVACIDAAGNASVRTDLFHLGFRSPNIVYPIADETESAESLIPIVGIAPPLSSSDSLTAVYRLRYKKCGDTDWLDDKIDVVAANRQQADSLHNYSRISQSTEGVLGYLKNEGFDDEDRVCIELAVASCLTCDDWKTGESSLIVKSPDEGTLDSRPAIVFDVSKQSFTAGEDSISVSLRLEGDFNSDYLLRVYAEDEKGVGLKDWSAQKVWRNPYYGVPSDSLVDAITSGVWFYQDAAGTYHLRWKNIGDTLGLQVMYDSKKMGQACAAPGGKNMESGCEVGVMPFDFISADIAKSYLEDYPEWIPPAHTDSVMKLSVPSGHIVLNAQGAFRVTLNGAYGVDTTKVNIPVYFGNGSQSGFYWVNGLEERYVSPLTTGWTANPQGYGLDFVWDGVAETGTFPAEGRVKLVAEVTENTAKSPHVHVETKELDVKLPALKVVLPNSIPDFYILNKDIDNGDSVAFRLDSMEIRYGIKNRDARVWMYILAPNGSVVNLLDSSSHRAFASDSAYSIRWSGKNAFDTPETAEGAYTVVLKAKSFVGGDSVQTDSTEMAFNVKYAESMLKMTPEDPKNSSSPSIYVSEAKKDAYSGDKYRYEPVADYLLQTDMSGWYLPDSLRDSLTVNAVASGKQKPLGFAAERFSLGILRQRDTLDLVILVDLDEKLDKNGCDSGKPTYDGVAHHRTRKKNIRFYKGKAELDTIMFYDNVDTIDNGRVFSIHQKSILNIYAFPANKKNYSKETLLADTANALAAFHYMMPIPERDHSGDTTAKWGAWIKSNNIGCKADSLHECTYDNNAYNPEVNLLKMYIEPQTIECKVTHTYGGYGTGQFKVWDWMDLKLDQCPVHKTYYYYELGQVRNGESCYNNDRGFEKIAFTLHLGIPGFYWKAGFGYDNLVNRTIRFDATNSTIYGETSGYLSAIEKESKLKDSLRRNTYFDGSKWIFNKKYGRVTAFETQHLPFFKTSQMDVAKNTFLFPGETVGYESPSHFTIKFYGRDSKSHFVTDVFAKKTDGSDYRNRLTSLKIDSIVTPMLKHGEMDFYVSFNKIVAESDKFFNDSSGHWIDFPLERDAKPSNNDSVKYYAAASRIHYYVGDYDNSLWKQKFSNGEYFKNLSNMSSGSQNLIGTTLNVNPESIKVLGLDDSSFEKNKTKRIGIVLNSYHYEKAKHRFYAAFGMGQYSEAGLNYSINFVLDNVDTKLYESSNDTVYVKAAKWFGHAFLRRTGQNLDLPKRTNPVRVEFDKLYSSVPWQKEVVIDTARITFLDSSNHSHFETTGNFSTSNDIVIQYKNVVGEKRIPEFIELRAYLKAKTKYNLAYMNRNTFYSVSKSMLDSVWHNGIWTDSSGDYRLGWFNVNKLQGNTQFLLTWGDSQNENAYYYSTFDLIVGGSVAKGSYRTVISPLEDASVTFFDNSLTENKDVTVRTVDAKDYPFEVFNNLALKGPIVEVLPKMTFEDTTAFPRIQMKISREEMTAMRATPQTLRLYKVDFMGKRFVPLENALYGFLKADGSAVMDGADTLKCSDSKKMEDKRCAGKDIQWSYLLISAETRTFSVFTTLNSAIAETPNFGITVLPEIAATVGRTIRVDGISKFRLYVDDDSLWANRNDTTPPVTLVFSADSNGFAHISLPSQTGVVDTNYIFAVALSEPDIDGNVVELPAAPAVARAITVPSEFACSVPSDSLWLGLDNGYMAYGASCNHPGVGTVSLYREGKVVAEIHGNIPDTLIYDGSRVYGASVIGKIANGVYESRYLGVSSLGTERQLAGPLVYMDSVRPSVEGFDVQESFEILDRVFTVTAKVRDSESGVAAVTVSPEFGGTSLEKTTLQPDSLGNVIVNLRMSRKSIAGCIGCRLKLSFRAEDYGHNHADTTFTTERLYPYPGELALWYPAREGAGRTAHEFLGTGHDLNLSLIRSPWQSDAGIYLSSASDRAAGAGRVDLGTADSYTLETRIKRGHSPDTWNDILSFAGPGGLSIKLSQKGRSLKLSEGGREWFSGEVLSASTKTWEHVAVVSDSSGVRFYVDGERVKSVPDGIAAERELYGTLTLGGTSGNSFVGNIADVRFYSGALTDAEIATLSVPATDDGDPSSVIVVAVKDMDVLDGFSGQFSCAVAGNRYLLAGSAHSRLRVTVNVETAGSYRIVAYARSANLSSADVSVGEGSLLSGQISLSGVWRTTEISGVSLSLSRGIHTLSLDVPEGVQLGGIALTRGSVSPSMIAWGRSSFDMVPATVNPPKILTSLKFEGFGDLSMLRPRIRMKNVSDETVNGYSVRYYFRGEDPSQVQVAAFYPYATSGLAVHSESARTGYAEWNFAGESLAPRDSAFYGEGPHFGLYNADWSPWNVGDDPSYVAAAEYGFAEDAGIVVLDRDNNLIGGRCAEMEDETSVVAKARILASDMRNDNQASEIHFKVENLGNVALRNFDIRYYFYVEEGLAPIMDINHLASCSTAELTSLGGGRWQVNVHCGGAIGAGNSMENPVNISLHLSGWANIWNASDDPGHAGLSGDMSEAHGICVFDSLGNRIYGESPQWPESSVIAEELPNGGSGTNPDNGYHGDVAIPMARTEDGLVLTLDAWTSLSMDLVNAVGVPIKSIFNGTLAPGEQLVQVDWTGINMRTTYLVLKVNGTIKTTRLLSLM